nr:hypothetical protein CFP56_78363 [Quercus suber]
MAPVKAMRRVEGVAGSAYDGPPLTGPTPLRDVSLCHGSAPLPDSGVGRHGLRVHVLGQSVGPGQPVDGEKSTRRDLNCALPLVAQHRWVNGRVTPGVRSSGPYLRGTARQGVCGALARPARSHGALPKVGGPLECPLHFSKVQRGMLLGVGSRQGHPRGDPSAPYLGSGQDNGGVAPGGSTRRELNCPTPRGRENRTACHPAATGYAGGVLGQSVGVAYSPSGEDNGGVTPGGSTRRDGEYPPPRGRKIGSAFDLAAARLRFRGPVV